MIFININILSNERFREDTSMHMYNSYEHRGRSEVDAGGGGGGARHVAGEVFLLGVHPDLSFLGGPLPGEGRAVRASPHSLSHCEM